MIFKNEVLLDILTIPRSISLKRLCTLFLTNDWLFRIKDGNMVIPNGTAVPQ